MNPKLECWEWKRHKNKRGYGVVQFRGKHCLVHRLVYHIFNGPLYNKELVLHRCDNPYCWNPKHLFKGTQKENISDMYKKGRQHPQADENNNHRKLSDLSVSSIRDLYKTGNFTQAQLARKFNTHQSNICLIVNRKVWK